MEALRFGCGAGLVHRLKSCLCGRCFTKAFLVGGCEVGWHVGPSARADWQLAPILDSFGEDSTLLESEECQAY